MKLARRILELRESATLAVASKAARMKAEGVDVIGFGAGEPDFATPANIKKACHEAIDAGHTGYSKPPSGLPIAKQAVCTKFARDNDLHYTPEQVIVTAGGKMGCYLAIHALINPGDEVIIPKPYWVSYPEMVKLAGGTPIFLSGDQRNDYKISPDDLRSALSERTRLFLFNSPSNPGGFTYTPDEVRALAAVLHGHDVCVLADEIYDQLIFGGMKTISFAATSDEAFSRTITLNAASKSYAMTGWRIGYAAGPVEIIKAMAKLQSQSTSGAATFNQHALAAALTQDQSAVVTMCKEFEKRAANMYSRLGEMPGVRCHKPTGAFYCFPNVASAMAKLGVSGSAALADHLLEEAKVAVVPGIAFGMDDHVRLSFALGMEQIEEGLNRIDGLLRA